MDGRLKSQKKKSKQKDDKLRKPKFQVTDIKSNDFQKKILNRKIRVINENKNIVNNKEISNICPKNSVDSDN